MSPCMVKYCQTYFDKVHLFSNSEDYFFPSADGSAIKLQNVYKNFRKFLWQAEISHGGRGKGPRIHDLRHTFAVNRMKQWVIDGENLNEKLPILQQYLGHESYYDTVYYLRLTSEMYPFIIKETASIFGNIIPRLEVIDNE